MIFLQVLAALVGAAGVVWFLTSAVRTVVMPRPERVWLTGTAFDLARRASGALASRFQHHGKRHRILGSFAPAVLISLPLIWSVGVIASFSAVFWGLSDMSWQQSIELSGSSLTTLGFTPAPTFVTRLVAMAEAVIGLALVALMISFLPTLYGTFSRREVAVGRFTTRAGEPPDPYEFLVRLHTIDRLHHVGDRWAEWEDWFVELGETHTTFPALIYFRSARPNRSWLGAAESALDTAAISTSAQLTPATGEADTMIRSGYLALRSIADFYDVEPEQPSEAWANISVTRAQFDSLLDALESRGIQSAVTRDQAWEGFCGWRVNYDKALLGLRHLVQEVPSHWDLHRGNEHPNPGSVT